MRNARESYSTHTRVEACNKARSKSEQLKLVVRLRRQLVWKVSNCMHNNYAVRKSFHTLIAGFILEVHCRSSRKEKVINIHDISGGTVDEQLCCFGCDP